MTIHIPVLLKETIANLNLKDKGIYLDATLGGGGHTLSLIKAAEKKDFEIKIIALDHDKKAIEEFENVISKKGFLKNSNNYSKNKIVLILENSNFDNLNKILRNNQIESIDGAIADLGLSTDQLEDNSRGFSFKKSSDLDLRMDTSLGVKAADLLNVLGKKELIKMFREFGDIEKEIYRLVNEIIKFRTKQNIKTTDDLLEIINKAVNFNSSRNFNARVFQALRIVVNNELNSLTSFLPQTFEALRVGGSMSIITFHSGEDRIVKRYQKQIEKKSLGKINLIYPTSEEVQLNPKASSAKLRTIEKL